MKRAARTMKRYLCAFKAQSIDGCILKEDAHQKEEFDQYVSSEWPTIKRCSEVTLQRPVSTHWLRLVFPREFKPDVPLHANARRIQECMKKLMTNVKDVIFLSDLACRAKEF